MGSPPQIHRPLINLVWLKRDLRTQDHRPLFEAEREGIPYLVIYLLEPNMMDYRDTSLRHLRFVYHSILEMNAFWLPCKREVQLLYGEAIAVFSDLIRQFKIKRVLSYRESGIRLTWERDKKLGELFQKKGVGWRQFQRDGILRGIRNRDGWDKQWFVTMNEAVIKNTYRERSVRLEANSFRLPEVLVDRLQPYDELFQPAGESKAWRYLESFAVGRGASYHWHLSKPAESRLSCSRISPYLAWGNISIRQAYQFIKHHPNYPRFKRAFGAFLTRLKWHCHFIQKFEMECDYETRCINRGYELLEHEFKEDWIVAWQEGQTGYPLIDACMRCVRRTGWINFRMRAMLVSFLCHHLDQDWRSGAPFLARQFLDYEPGIHYPQFQMQAGTTGVNTVRMYNPVKQSNDHDATGVFIRKWVPEIYRVPREHIHEPWKMSVMEQQFCQTYIGTDYPSPIVPLEESARKAREKIWGHRSHPLVEQEQKRILRKHTRRKK